MLANNTPPLLPTPLIKPSPAVMKGNKNFKFIYADVRTKKIAKGLCYYYDQAYEKGHKCKFREPQLFTVEVLGDLINDEESDGIETGEFQSSVM